MRKSKSKKMRMRLKMMISDLWSLVEKPVKLSEKSKKVGSNRNTETIPLSLIS